MPGSNSPVRSSVPPIIVATTLMPCFAPLVLAVSTSQGLSPHVAVALFWVALGGCLIGLVGGLWLAARRSMLWLLLMIPGFADGYIASAIAFAMEVSGVH